MFEFMLGIVFIISAFALISVGIFFIWGLSSEIGYVLLMGGVGVLITMAFLYPTKDELFVMDFQRVISNNKVVFITKDKIFDKSDLKFATCNLDEIVFIRTRNIFNQIIETNDVEVRQKEVVK